MLRQDILGPHQAEYSTTQFSERDFLTMFDEYKADGKDSKEPSSRKKELAEKLVAMNERMIRQVAYKIYIPLPDYFKDRIDLDDLFQVGRMTAYEALGGYDTQIGKWSTYLHVSLDRRMRSEIDRMRTLKISAYALKKQHSQDGYPFSLDGTQYPEGTQSIYYDTERTPSIYYELLLPPKGSGSFNPVVKQVLINESHREFLAYKEVLREAVLTTLKNFPIALVKPKMYFDLFFVQGLSTAEIAAKFQVTTKTVTYGLRCIYDYLWTNIPDELSFLKGDEANGKKYLKGLLRVLWPQSDSH